MLEMVCVVAVVALLITIVMGSPGLVTSGRDTTAVQELAAVIESARAKAMRGVETSWVAFSGREGASPFASYAVCGEEQDGTGKLRPREAWRKLPSGFVFTDVSPALDSAGVNLGKLDATGTIKPVITMGESGVLLADCRCIGFGALGEVIHPKTDGRPILVAFAQGEVFGTDTRALSGESLEPGKCRWISIQPATGKVTILP